MRLEAIKVQILSKLGMERPPNISQAQLASIPPLRHLMHRGLQDMPMADEPSQSRRDAAADAYDDDNDDYMLRPERIFSRSRTEVPEGFVRRVPDSIIFTFSPREMNMRASRAYLWFSLQPSRTLDAFIYVNVYIADKKHATRVRVLYRQKKVALSSGSSEWHSIEVRSLVAGWFRRIQQRHFELIVEAFDSSGRQLVIDSEPTSDDSVDTGDTMPLLEVRLQQQRHSRKKRMVGLDCDEFSHEERCCRYKLVVDFQEFGWDWILNPKRYDANYCSGECPFVFLQKYLHTHLVQQANPHGSAGPCCTPEKMSPLSMLYFDDSQNIMYGVLSGMIVDKCGCS